ncbi:Wzz/FepE/Etk N-terminal domain-containing protein [Modestobacter roseus]|uniref:Capsular polysaccharide biosynthesis protein n=1 Tax=Modestobacter roseus TaxID=1181884 RepID=A0A562IXI5_9ACTN|nr:Wzz/FepE/Etk N-terminal domain-containing protein [Modestobacter roseus]MQA33377.1 hypothetical protein [Modestobacter roseus]TWH75295.1 capsular polysaccharide biosynthesis protein [Modestobacter roseus]
MTFRELGRALRRGALLVAVCTVLGAVAAVAFAALRTPEYTAGVQLFLGASEESDGGVVTRQDTAYLQQRMPSYAAVLGSPLLGERIAGRLALDLTGAEVAAEMAVQVPAETVLLDVQVTDPSPDRAQAIANAAGDAFSALLAELEDTPGATVDAVQVTTIRPAALPTDPAPPTATVLVAAGALLGLAVGVALALARAATDDRVHSADELVALGVPVLAVVPARDRRRPAGGPTGPVRGEALRRLRALLGDRAGRRPDAPRVVTVLSPTTSADSAGLGCDLAVVLAAADVRTVLVDADMPADRAATGLLGLAGQTSGTSTVLTGQVAVHQALVRGPHGLQVLPAGPQAGADVADALAGPRMAELLTEVSAGTDVTLVLAPALDQHSGATALAALADGVVLVLRAGRTTRREIRDATTLLTTLDTPLIGAVLEEPAQRGSSARTHRAGVVPADHAAR